MRTAALFLFHELTGKLQDLYTLYAFKRKLDDGGANIGCLAGTSVDELKEACSEMAECVPPRFFCFTSSDISAHHSRSVPLNTFLI